MLPLSYETKYTLVSGVVSSGTTTINGSAVDMQGWLGVVFLVSYGTSAADNGIKAQQGKASGMGDAADLEGSKKLLDGTQKQVVLDIYKPDERYVRPSILRGTGTTIEAVWAIQYRPNSTPVDNATVNQATKVVTSPSEGTA